MTAALKAMVEAMVAERDRQIVDDGADMADDVDLEKVARVGLAAYLSAQSGGKFLAEVDELLAPL